ncbi:hypothetical protein ACFIJ5_05285 [Haloimpatiens sp. FM7330]|uniref:hypothetical protein n=1 Tax=Haloimpatiens sp. FM7330 TaxID=3298610 RepID=UPI0036350A99
MGKDSITNFINFIEELYLNNKPDLKLLNNIVCSNLQTQSYDVISKLSNETTKLVFQDATFKDSKYNKHGEITRIDWTLSFRGMLKDTSQPKNYTFNLVLKPCKNSKDKFHFKISSISLTVLK